MFMIEVSTLWGVERIHNTKKCIKCGEEKELSEFGFRSRDKDGNPSEYRNDCKSCQKQQGKVVSKLKKYNAYPSDPDYKCPICNRTKEELPETFKDRGFVLDHDHITGKFRGYICHYCNIGLSRFHDNVESLKRAINYLNSGIE